MGTCTFIQQYPSIRRKTDLHLTTDSTQLIVLMVANIFNSSRIGSDCCCTNHNRHRHKFQMSRSGPKTTPTNHGPREKQSDKEQRSPHQIINNKNLPDKAAGRIIEFSNDFWKNCTKVKTDVEIHRLLQHPLLCKALSRCLHQSRSK